MWKSVLYNRDFNSAFIETLRPNSKDYGGIVVENTVPSTAVLLGKVTRGNVVHLNKFHLFREHWILFLNFVFVCRGIAYVEKFVTFLM